MKLGQSAIADRILCSSSSHSGPQSLINRTEFPDGTYFLSDSIQELSVDQSLYTGTTMVVLFFGLILFLFYLVVFVVFYFQSKLRNIWFMVIK